MKRILTAVVLIPVVLLIVLRAPLWVVAMAVALVAFLATREYLDIIEHYGIKPFRRIALLTSIVACLLPAVRMLAESQVHLTYFENPPRLFWFILQLVNAAGAFFLTLPLLLLALALHSE